MAGFFLEHFLSASLSVPSFPLKPDARKEKEEIYLTSIGQRQFCFSLPVAGVQIGFSSCGMFGDLYSPAVASYLSIPDLCLPMC